MTYADSLKGKLLLIHSMMDDNVHPINTMHLLTALENAGKTSISGSFLRVHMAPSIIAQLTYYY